DVLQARVQPVRGDAVLLVAQQDSALLEAREGRARGSRADVEGAKEPDELRRRDRRPVTPTVERADGDDELLQLAASTRLPLRGRPRGGPGGGRGWHARQPQCPP